MALAARVHSALLQAGQVTEQDITRRAREHARVSGWPADAAKNLHAHVEGGRFQMHFDGAEDWEYGTEDQPPVSVARHWETRTDTQVNQTFEAHLHRALRGLL